MKRYSSRNEKLDEAFLNKKLVKAKNYDRIAGYFCSSILEVAGESIEAVSGTVRVVCNSGLSKEDVTVACHAQKMKQEWCAYEPEEKYTSDKSGLYGCIVCLSVENWKFASFLTRSMA